MPRITIGSFSLDVPAGWTLSTVILVGSPEADPISPESGGRRFQTNLVATMEQVAADVEVDDYMRRADEGLRKAQIESGLIGEPEDVSLANDQLSGLLAERIVVGPDGDRVRQLQLVTIKDGVAHTIITSQLEGTAFETKRGLFREILLSLE